MSKEFSQFPFGAPLADTDRFLIGRPDVLSPSGFSNYIMTWAEIKAAVGVSPAASPPVFPMPMDGLDGLDGFSIPGARGADGVGTPGVAGRDGNIILLPDSPEEPLEPMMIPGPKGDTGSAGGGGGVNLLRTTANQTINSGAGTFTDITGLTFPVVNGVDYAFMFYITFRSAQTTTGWRAGVNCPAGTLDFWAGSDVIANGAAGVATHTERHNVTRDDMTLLTSTVTAAVDLAVRISGRYLCTADGTFAARFANELAANTDVVVQKGSWGLWF